MINNEKSIEIYQSIKNSDKPRVFEHWHASSIADCPRTHYFKRLGIPPVEQPSSAKMLRWKAGHLMEEAIREHIKNVYGETESNKRFTSKKMDLTGEFDNLVLAGNKLVEIKSIHDNAFIERDGITYLKENLGKQVAKTGRETNKWGAKERPYLHHELQNHAYVLLLAENGIEVDSIDYVYLSLSGRVVVYSTKVDTQLINNVKTRLRALQIAWKAQIPPDCICDSKHPLYAGVMQYCNYKTETGCCSLKLLEDKK